MIDWKNPENNTFLMVNQLWVTGQVYKRRVDMVGFINGIPLVFVELKASHKHIEDAYNNNLRNYKDTIAHLFWYNGFIILSNGSQSKIGSITSTIDFFNEWKRVASEKEPVKVSLEAVLRGTCDKEKVLDILENFVLYKNDNVKIIPKNHQYLGVNSAIEAVYDINNRNGKLGVFWHTQGSGKSFSMVFFTQKILRKIPGNWTFVIVTDRTDLDDQIYKTYGSVGAINEKCQADSCDNNDNKENVHGLKQLLQEDHRLVFTLIQKFQWEDVSRLVTLRDDIIVITDEAYRSQYDTLAHNMRKALPNASFIGFTGTPLVEGNAIREMIYDGLVNAVESLPDKTKTIFLADLGILCLYCGRVSKNRIPQQDIANMYELYSARAVQKQVDKAAEGMIRKLTAKGWLQAMTIKLTDKKMNGKDTVSVTYAYYPMFGNDEGLLEFDLTQPAEERCIIDRFTVWDRQYPFFRRLVREVARMQKTGKFDKERVLVWWA